MIDARPLLAGAPSLGKMVAAARYRVAAPPAGEWPDTPDSLPGEIRAGILSWDRREDGALRLELNLRQEDGPIVSVKSIAAAHGLDAATVVRLRAIRERLVLRPRAGAGTAAGTVEVATT